MTSAGPNVSWRGIVLSARNRSCVDVSEHGHCCRQCTTGQARTAPMSVSEEARKIIRMDGVTIHVVYR